MTSLELLPVTILAAFDSSLLIPTLALVGALLIGALVIAVFRRWQLSDKPLGPSASDQLAEFRSLYEKGAISEEEFKRLRSVLGGEIRQAMHSPTPPATAGTSPTSPTPSDNLEPPPPKPNGEDQRPT